MKWRTFPENYAVNELNHVLIFSVPFVVIAAVNRSLAIYLENRSGRTRTRKY